MFIKLSLSQTEFYNSYLSLYTRLTGLNTTYIERTEAFLAIQNNTKPNWAAGFN